MIVYAESNFVLELAFRQEECESCEEVVKLAEAGRIRLALPAYCVGEPYERMVRRDRQRRDVHRRLTDELRELGRSAPYAESVSRLGDLTGLLVEAGEQEMSQLNQVLTRLLDVATLIPIDANVLRGALEAQATLGLSPQDSIVYASIRSQVVASGDTQCFLNKNAKDFLIPQIDDEFSAHACKILTSFSNGIGYIASVISQAEC